MLNITNNLEKIMNLRELNKREAYSKYMNQCDIYVKISDEIWMKFNIASDGEFPKFDDGIKYYINCDDENSIIVTRHQNIVDWFNSKGIFGKVYEVVRPNDVVGKTIYGTNLPLHIVSFAKEAYIINIQNTTGKEFDELTADDIENCYHQVRKYDIQSCAVNL